MIPYFLIIFIISMALLAWAGSWVVGSLIGIAKYLGLREFVVAFFLMAFASSLPNLAVGITSAVRGVPELSFGDVVGGNVFDLTAAVGLVVLISRVNLPAEGSLLQTSALLSSFAAVLPLLLIADGNLTRGDGVVLIFAFFLYIFWLFSKGERFKRPYEDRGEEEPIQGAKCFLKNFAKAAGGVIFLVLGAQGVVGSASLLAQAIHIPIPVLGILLLGIGNCLPEVYFAILSARRGKTEMILGDLMGSVIVPATLVLGIVAFIRPVVIEDFSVFAIARFFLIVAAILFYIAAKTGRKISRKEAFHLFGIYLLFFMLEIITKK